MALHLIAKLEQFTRLSPADKQALQAMAALRVRQLSPREDIIQEGDKPRNVNLILNGWAYRYKHLEDGRRQIAAFLIPGDMCDLRMFILREMDHSIGALTPLKVAEIPSDTLLEIADSSPRISRALWWNSLVEEAIQREWILNIGRRNATERLAHLVCELCLRLRVIGMTKGEGRHLSFEAPVTQEQLGDATGLSTVHVNRTLQELRDDGLIVWKGRQVTVPDLQRLMDAAFFTPNYLHLERNGWPLEAHEG